MSYFCDQSIRTRYGFLLSELSLWLLCVIMLYSMRIYVLWDRTYVFYLVVSLFCFIRIGFLKRKIGKKKLIECYLCLLMYSVLDLFHLCYVKELFPYILQHVLLVWMVILLSNKEKIRLLELFSNIYTGIVGCSLFFYMLHFFGVNLPSKIVGIESNTSYPDFLCYPFLLIPNDLDLFYRFQSVFLEPGHLGMISALLLYVNQYSLRKISVWILFLSILLSLSLAAYMLLLIGFVLHYVMSGKFLKRLLVVFLYIATVIILGISLYVYNPDAAFSKTIVERLEYDESKGISGNNRTTESFDSFYEQRFYKGWDCLLGVGPKEFSQNTWGDNRGQGGNASYKVFIVKYGLLGIFVLVLFFSMYTYFYRSKLLFGLLLLYAASFLQRPYALWEVELFLFIGYGVLSTSMRNQNIFEGDNSKMIRT